MDFYVERVLQLQVALKETEVALRNVRNERRDEATRLRGDVQQSHA